MRPRKERSVLVANIDDECGLNTKDVGKCVPICKHDSLWITSRSRCVDEGIECKRVICNQSANIRVSLDCSAQDPATSSRMIIIVNFLTYLCMIFNRWVNKTNIHAALSAVETLKQGLMQPDYPRTKGRVKQVGPPSPLRLISNPL